MTRLPASRLVAPLIPLLLGIEACNTLATRTSPEPGPTRTIVEVQNKRWDEVTIYLLQGTVPITLGVVPAMRSRSFSLSNAFLGSGTGLRLVVEAFGSRERHASEPISVVPGNRIEWVVEHRMKYSSLVIH